jgi:fatty acid desaturase
MALLIYSAVQNIGTGKGDIANPLPWAIIIFVFIPVAIGMTIFGWYAWKGEYDGEIKT